MSILLQYDNAIPVRPVSKWAITACAAAWLAGPLLLALQMLLPTFVAAYPVEMEAWYYPVALSPIILSTLLTVVALISVIVDRSRVSGFWVIAGAFSTDVIWLVIISVYISGT